MPLVIKNTNNNCYLCSLLSIFVSLGIVKHINYLDDNIPISKYIVNLDVEGIKRELDIVGDDMQDAHHVYMSIMENYRYTSLWDKICIKYIENNTEYETSSVSVNKDISTSYDTIQTSPILVLHFKVPIRMKDNILKIHNYKVKAFLHYKKNHYYVTIIEDGKWYIVDKDVRYISRNDILEQKTYMVFLKRI